MTGAMPFLQKTILLSYDPRSFGRWPFFTMILRSAAPWLYTVLVYWPTYRKEEQHGNTIGEHYKEF